MKYVAPGRKYQVLIESHFSEFDDGSFDFRVSITGIYISLKTFFLL